MLGAVENSEMHTKICMAAAALSALAYPCISVQLNKRTDSLHRSARLRLLIGCGANKPQTYNLTPNPMAAVSSMAANTNNQSASCMHPRSGSANQSPFRMALEYIKGYLGGRFRIYFRCPPFATCVGFRRSATSLPGQTKYSFPLRSAAIVRKRQTG